MATTTNASTPTFFTFTITVADPEQGRSEQVRDCIIDAVKDHADLTVLQMDYGTQLTLHESE